MSKLLSIDPPLNKTLKQFVSSTSQRLLTGGLGVSTQTTANWMRAVGEINEKKFLLGKLDKSRFAYLDCPNDISEKGNIEMNLCVSLIENTVTFNIESNLVLSTGQGSWKVNTNVKPMNYELVKLGHRDLKIFKSVIKPINEILLVNVLDLQIETEDKVLKAEYSEEGVLSFGSSISSKKYSKNNDKQYNNNNYQSKNPVPFEFTQERISSSYTPFNYGGAFYSDQGPSCSGYQTDYRNTPQRFVHQTEQYRFAPPRTEQYRFAPPRMPYEHRNEPSYENRSDRSDLGSEASEIGKQLKYITNENNKGKPCQDEEKPEDKPTPGSSSSLSEPVNIKNNEIEYNDISISPEFAELWMSSKSNFEENEKDKENCKAFLLEKIDNLEEEIVKLKIENKFFSEVGSNKYFHTSLLETQTMTSYNVDQKIPTLYHALRVVAVQNFDLLKEWTKGIDAKIFGHIRKESTSTKVKQYSHVLVRHFQYLRDNVQTHSFHCQTHKLHFNSKANLMSHFRSKGHLDQNSWLYLRYQDFLIKSKTYSLTWDDEEFVCSIDDQDIDVVVSKVNFLRKYLPIICLMDFSEHYNGERTDVQYLLTSLCDLTGISDQTDTVIQEFIDQKV